MEHERQSDGRLPARDPHQLAAPWLEYADRAVYVLVALLFLAAAMAMGAYAVYTFVGHLGNDFQHHLIIFINDLLLVLIIMEVLGTVRSYLVTGTTSLQPFLYIGIISATRRILAIGAESTVGGNQAETMFRHSMIDLGVNGAVVLALALALFLFGRHRGLDEAAMERESAPAEDVS